MMTQPVTEVGITQGLWYLSQCLTGHVNNTITADPDNTVTPAVTTAPAAVLTAMTPVPLLLSVAITATAAVSPL